MNFSRHFLLFEIRRSKTAVKAWGSANGYLIFQVIVVLLVVTGFIIAIIYLLGEYILKWRPWGKFSNLSDQIKYWSERVEECFKGFQILQDLFKDEDHTKVIQFMNHINFGYKKSDIRSKFKID